MLIAAKYITCIFVLLLGIIPNSIAQKKPKKNSINVAYGDEYFSNGDFFQAEQYYSQALLKQENSSYITYRIAECNRLIFNYKKAEEMYGKTLANPAGVTEYPLTLYWYALMQKTNGKYEEAKGNFDKFIQEFSPKNKQDQDYLEQAKHESKGCDFAMKELKRPQKDYNFTLLPAPVNSKSSDYAPAVFHNDSSVMITSSRENTTGGQIYEGIGEYFSDNFRFEKKKDGKWIALDNRDLFYTEVNTKRNDGAGILTKDKKKFYYTQCDDDNGACGIYVTKQVAGKWQKPIKLNDNINNPGGWNAQPTLNLKADTLYFVSKREGGLGMHDIWYSISHKGEDHWDKPVNMGPAINTPFIDMSPSYYADEKALFFASNGRDGFGGLDVYMAKGDSLKTVTNMGLPFNSNKDDFYFVLGEQKGFLSSNRESGLGSDDIYTFSIQSRKSLLALINTDSLSPLAESVSVRGKILDDQTMKGVEDVDNMLADDKGNLLKKSKTNKEGVFRYDNLATDKNYVVLLEDKDNKLTSPKNMIVTNVEVVSSTAKSTKNHFENIYFDYDKADLRPEAIKVLDELSTYCLQNPHVQVELRANTDNLGKDDYNVNLSKRRGNAAMDYMVQKGIDKSVFVVDARGEGTPMATNDNDIGRQLNRRVEFYILGAENLKSQGIIYVIEPKNTLFSVAKQFGMTVEELKALNGIETNEVKAFSPLRVRRIGDADLVAPVTLSSLHNINVNASHEGVYVNPDIKTGEAFHTVQPGNTLFSIAKQYNMSVEELRGMNGLGSNRISIGQRLKVKK